MKQTGKFRIGKTKNKMIVKMIHSQLYKVFSKKLFIILSFVLLILNGFSIYNSQIIGNDSNFISAEAKINLNHDLENIPDNTRKNEFVKSRLNAVYDETSEIYTDDSYSDRKLLESTKVQLEIVTDYNAYAQSVIDEANNIMDISIFADSNSFAYKNAAKTAEDYSALLDVHTSYDSSDGVNMAIDFVLTDLIVILLLCIVCDALIGSERSINITGLQRTCPNGRGGFALSVITAAFIATAVICSSFYGMNYVVSGFIYGFGDVSRVIQSVEGFADCTLKISVLQFLILHFVSKILVMYLICLIMNVLSMLGKSKIGSYVIFAGLSIISYIFYIAIGDNSGAMWLRYINLISFIDVKSIIAVYRNINLFGNPISYFPVFSVALLSLLLIFGVLCVLIYKYKRILGYNKYEQGVLSKIKLSHGGVRAFSHEMYKALVINKVGLIFLAVLILQIIVNVAYPLNLNEEEKYEKYYFTYFSGEFNEYKRVEIESKIKELEASENNTDEYQKFDKYVIPYHEYLCSQAAEDKKVSVVNYKGFSTALGINGNVSNLYCLALYSLIIICTVPIFTSEYERKTTLLLSSTKTGLKKLMFKKMLCSEMITLILNLLIFTPYFIRIISTYGIGNINEPACSIPSFGSYTDNISILQLLVFAFAVRMLSSLLITFIINAISLMGKNTVISAIISSLLFAIPLLLPLNNITILNSFSLYRFQNFSGLL